MTYEKHELLHYIKERLKAQEQMLDYYAKHIPHDEIHYAMRLADEANRQNYENIKQFIQELEEEIGKPKPPIG